MDRVGQSTLKRGRWARAGRERHKDDMQEQQQRRWQQRAEIEAGGVCTQRGHDSHERAAIDVGLVKHRKLEGVDRGLCRADSDAKSPRVQGFFMGHKNMEW